MLGTRIGDKSLLKLIGKFLRAGMLSDGLVSQRVKGTPQGSPLSPLLSNIVLDELDKELEVRGHRFVRYADDLIVMVKSEASAKRVTIEFDQVYRAAIVAKGEPGKEQDKQAGRTEFSWAQHLKRKEVRA